ncbi:hypothetical protein TNCV_2170231 [Trichonephila clavipes]|nr:hypothetical protein TNCV_2170231 [Trichonephila clavipes]
MFDSSSFVNPTPLAHADTPRDVLPMGGTSQVLVTDRVILNDSLVMRTSSELVLPLLTSTPRQRENILASTYMTCIDPLHGGSSVVLGSN